MSDEAKNPQPIDPIAEAQAVLEQAKQQRVQQCAAEVQAILNKYGCKIVPITLLVNNQLSQRVDIVAA